MKKVAFILSIIVSFLASQPVLAAPKTIQDLIESTYTVFILPLPAILLGLAVCMFIYGVIKLMIAEGGEKKEEGKQYMVWGIVGITVIVSIWGLVALLVEIFGLSDNIPKIEIRRAPSEVDSSFDFNSI